MKINLGNLLFSGIGLVGFLLGVIVFVMIAAGIDNGEGGPRSGLILFLSFVLCSGVAFTGLIVMALTQISSTLSRIEEILKLAHGKPQVND